MTSTVKHLHTIDSAIKPGDWNRIRLSVDRVYHFFRDTDALKSQTKGLTSDLGDDKFDYRVESGLFFIKRKWPKDWYGSASLRSVFDCTEGFELFQRACLIISSRFARSGGVDFIITTEGSLEGWYCAGRIAALATGDPIYGEQNHLDSLVLGGALTPESEKARKDVDRTDWAPTAIDRDLMALAASVLDPARAPLSWPASHSWFF